jgi:hypothetical protein
MSTLHRLSFAAVVVTALLVGCGQGENAKVVGSVTYNGQPLENGSVIFEPMDGDTSFTASIINGRFEAEQAQVGQFKATVQAGPSGPAASSREAFNSQAQTAKDKQQPANEIPADAEGNGQTVEVTRGEQTLDLALTGPVK